MLLADFASFLSKKAPVVVPCVTLSFIIRFRISRRYGNV